MNTNYRDIQWDLSAEEIEAESFRQIEQECLLHQQLPLDEWRVARRLIHTSADLHIADTLIFQHHPVEAALNALRKKAPLYCDSNMIRAGLSLERLRRMHVEYSREDILCFISDIDIIEQAKNTQRTRAICAAEKARSILNGAIVLIGNAPLALARIARFILEENIQPALVIGMPVGFVNVIESKQLLKKTNIPSIILEGRRGGSPLALTTLHAIIESA